MIKFNKMRDLIIVVLEDPDLIDLAQTLYRIVNGRVETFAIDPKTNQETSSDILDYFGNFCLMDIENDVYNTIRTTDDIEYQVDVKLRFYTSFNLYSEIDIDYQLPSKQYILNIKFNTKLLDVDLYDFNLSDVFTDFNVALDQNTTNQESKYLEMIDNFNNTILEFTSARYNDIIQRPLLSNEFLNGTNLSNLNTNSIKESTFKKLMDSGKLKVISPKEIDYDSKTMNEWMKILSNDSIKFETHFNKFNELNPEQWNKLIKTIPKYILEYDKVSKINLDLIDTNVMVSYFPNTIFWLL